MNRWMNEVTFETRLGKLETPILIRFSQDCTFDCGVSFWTDDKPWVLQASHALKAPGMRLPYVVYKEFQKPLEYPEVLAEINVFLGYWERAFAKVSQSHEPSESWLLAMEGPNDDWFVALTNTWGLTRSDLWRGYVAAVKDDRAAGRLRPTSPDDFYLNHPERGDDKLGTTATFCEGCGTEYPDEDAGKTCSCGRRIQFTDCTDDIIDMMLYLNPARVYQLALEKQTKNKGTLPAMRY